MKYAVIDENSCVGCTKCLPACPVDSIIGAHKFTHTVLTEECIGCGLCVAPCPMDCISMIDSELPLDVGEKKRKAEIAKARYKAKQERLIREKPKSLSFNPNDSIEKNKIKLEILAAVERVKNKKQ